MSEWNNPISDIIYGFRLSPERSFMSPLFLHIDILINLVPNVFVIVIDTLVDPKPCERSFTTPKILMNLIHNNTAELITSIH